MQFRKVRCKYVLMFNSNNATVYFKLQKKFVTHLDLVGLFHLHVAKRLCWHLTLQITFTFMSAVAIAGCVPAFEQTEVPIMKCASDCMNKQ